MSTTAWSPVPPLAPRAHIPAVILTHPWERHLSPGPSEPPQAEITEEGVEEPVGEGRKECYILGGMAVSANTVAPQHLHHQHAHTTLSHPATTPTHHGSTSRTTAPVASLGSLWSHLHAPRPQYTRREASKSMAFSRQALGALLDGKRACTDPHRGQHPYLPENMSASREPSARHRVALQRRITYHKPSS
jgi:hypothetical protein